MTSSIFQHLWRGVEESWSPRDRSGNVHWSKWSLVKCDWAVALVWMGRSDFPDISGCPWSAVWGRASRWF